METPIKDYKQQKVTGGEQRVILDEKETAETDELDLRPNNGRSAVNSGASKSATDSGANYDPGDDAKIELI